MQPWQIALAAAVPFALVVAVIVQSTKYCRKSPLARADAGQDRHDELSRADYYAGLRRLRHGEANRGGLVNDYSTKSFAWSDHPSLVAEAVEQGWATFSFTYSYPATPLFSSGKFWEMCSGKSSSSQAYEPEIGWEIADGEDFMQRIRFNPGLLSLSANNKKNNSGFYMHIECLQSVLPLPGPALGPGSFPQEAYFEINVIAEEGQKETPTLASKSSRENEFMKLISQGGGLSTDVPVNIKSSSSYRTSGSSTRSEFWKATKSMSCSGVINSSMREGSPRVLSVGLAVGGACLARLPGLESGSVGFHSTGFVYLNGMAYVDDAKEEQKTGKNRAWGGVNSVVGCGYEPSKNRVFYTLNGERVYSMTCKSRDFSNPLYPTIASSYDVTVLVNFGQNRFAYGPANSQRVSNPCFQKSRKHVNVPYEDSGDLFSIGKADSQWLGQTGPSLSEDFKSKGLFSEGDSDLFEIVIDGSK